MQASGGDAAVIFGGWADSEGSMVLPGMVYYNMSSQTSTNLTIVCFLLDDNVVYPSSTHYVPPFGPEELFVSMGGQAKLSYEGLIGFETVFVYDRNMQAGFNQITTDKALSPRIDFCTAGVASTNGTHEMQTTFHETIFREY